jgi:hypothetical protein
VPKEGITLHLNGAFAQTATTLVSMSELCIIGEELLFSKGGYGLLGNVEESTAPPFTLWGTTYLYGDPLKVWETSYSMKGSGSPGSWKLTGANAGKKYGLS